MKRTLCCIALVCLSCGGSTAPAESPTDVEGPSGEPSSAAANEPESASPPPTESETHGAAASEATGVTTAEDVQAILQLVLDDEELAPFLRLERPDRFPVRIAGELPAGIQLTKGTKPVELVDAGESKTKPVLVFSEIDVQGGRASVRYRYDVESVRGACTLEKRDGRWVLVRSRITAR